MSLGSILFSQHKPRLQRIQQLKRVYKRHPEVLANVGDQEFTAGGQVQLLMRHDRGVDRHGLGDQPRVCAAQKFIKRASFHLQGIAGHMLGHLGKSGLGIAD